MQQMANSAAIRASMLFLTLFVISCSKPIKSKQQLIEYLNDPKHGLVKTEEVNRIKATITFKPWQSIAKNYDKKDSSVLRNIKKRVYFVFSLSQNDKEVIRQLPFSKYSEMVQILAFRMRPLVSIVTDDGTVAEAEDCLFQQTYGMAKENELLLIFDRSKLQNAKTLDIKIKEFGLNTGDLDFNLQMNDIKDIPNISF